MAQTDKQGQAEMGSQRSGLRLSNEKIAQVRQARQASIRRRRVLAGLLLLAAAGLAAAAFFFRFSYWWGALPLALLVLVLVLGARAAAVARAWEAGLSKPATSATTTHAQAVSLIAGTVTSPVAPAAADSTQQPYEIENAPTNVLAVDEVQEIVRRQIMDKAAAQAEQSEQSAAKAATEIVSATKSAEATADSPLESSARSESPSAVAVSQPLAEQAQKPVLVSFSLGSAEQSESVPAPVAAATTDPDPAVNQATVDQAAESEPTGSAEIVSYRQVAKAVPLAPERQAALIAGLTPSSVSLDQVEAPARTDDSLGVDVDAVLARRQR